MVLNCDKQTWLMRIEAVNMDATIDDTNQLSVRRGASMAMREALKGIHEIPPLKKCSVQAIRRGGSIALLKLEQLTKDEAGTLRDAILKWLQGKDGSADEKLRAVLEQTGFCVSIIPVDEANDATDATVLEKLTAMNRFEQLQSPSLHMGDLQASTSGTGTCHYNGFRPAKGNDQAISHTVHKRFSYGKEQKQAFINAEIETQERYDFVNSLEDLSLNPGHGISTSLAGKMAVLYFDGNHFGKHQHDLDLSAQKYFDAELYDKRHAFLLELVKRFSATPQMKNGNKLRLELLLWGGDEVMLVVPGWAGFSTLRLFYKQMEGLGEKSIGTPLTHAGGLVFCSHKTPIQRISRLARELVEHAKEFSRKQDLYFPLLLESEDYPLQHVREHWEEHYGAFGRHILPISPPAVFQLEYLKELQEKGCKGLFRRWVVARHQGKKAEAETLKAELAKQMDLKCLESALHGLFPSMEKQVLANEQGLEVLLKQEICDHHASTVSLQPWIFTLEYWDYLLGEFLQEKQP
ncbi:Cas10/Cmr2 second palm domain-containing protein [Thiolapillus sp.]